MDKIEFDDDQIEELANRAALSPLAMVGLLFTMNRMIRDREEAEGLRKHNEREDIRREMNGGY